MCQCDGPPSQNGLTCPYLDGKDGTIYDATSGLTWQTVAMHTAVENGAVDGVRQLQLQCDGVALPGSFWRVPTRNELLTTIVTLFPIQLEPGCLAFSAPDNAAAMFMCGDLQTATYLRCVH
jgi:hypothetical protein